MTAQNPKVSIIIPVYNGSNYLKEAIESAINQTYPNCEVIVVNDGSEDGGRTEEIARSFGNRISYYCKKNGGVSTALNLGIKKMKGEYFSWLSHDDMYVTDKIEVEIERLRKSENPEGIVYSNFTVLDLIMNTEYTSDLHLRYPEENLKRGTFGVWVGAVHGCTLLIHRSFFEKIGTFDENLPTTQDYDLWYRMFRNRMIEFEPCSLVKTRRHREQGSQVTAGHFDERIKLYRGFMDHINREEKIWEFGSEYKFYADIITKFKQWGFEEECSQLRKELALLEEPECIEKDIKKFRSETADILGGLPEKICIFGAGSLGIELLYDFKSRGVEISYFIDNDVRKQGAFIEGIPCVPLGEIAEQDIAVVVSMENNREVLEMLKDRGIMHVAVRKSFSLLLFNTPQSKEYLMNGDANGI